MNLQELNPEQRRAVECTEGPLLILAGAGSGKTRVLTHRIAYLMQEKGVSPFEVLALTFTNKAAREMKERVEQLSGEWGNHVWISTFHACCARMLRVDIERLGGFSRDFVIYDDTDQLAVIVEVQKEMNISEERLPKRALRGLFSEAKNRSMQPVDYIRDLGRASGVLEIEAFERYQKKLRQNNALDFDDLLARTLELFQSAPDVLEKYQERFHYIHVDEYQDTNQPQYVFVRALAAKHRNLCVVGDDDQSIYGWRGADIENILGFERDYPDAMVIRLEQNYRSTQNILSAANSVINCNLTRKKKKLWTDAGAGERIGLYSAWSERDEADFVCRNIESLSTEYRYGDFAVLYRTNAQSRVLEDTLVAYGIPYTVYGSLRFYDRKEIKDVLAYLRLMVNPHDEISLRRVINVPKRGIGDASVAELERAANHMGVSLFDACLQAEQLALSSRTKGKIQRFGELLAQLRALSELMPLHEFVTEMLNLVDYWGYLEGEKRSDGKEEQRKENVQEFINAVTAFAAESLENTLSAFLENVALVANVNDDSDVSAVTLMTLHSAKGLEFPVVFMVGMEDGLFPTSRAFLEESNMEEERRLAYVGITRAKEKLFLSYARSRMQYNNVSRNPSSRFLKEIPVELLDQPGGIENIEDGYMSWQGKPGHGEAGRGGYGEGATDNFYGGSNSGNRPQPRFGRSTATASSGQKLGVSPHSAAPKPATPQKKYDFTLYQDVEHSKFGEGKIIAMEGGVLTIDFADYGVKKIAASFAPLKPLDED